MYVDWDNHKKNWFTHKNSIQNVSMHVKPLKLKTIYMIWNQTNFARVDLGLQFNRPMEAFLAFTYYYIIIQHTQSKKENFPTKNSTWKMIRIHWQFPVHLC